MFPLFVNSYVDLPGYSAKMGTLFRDPQEGEPTVQTIALTKIVCGPSESQLVMLQLERCALSSAPSTHTHSHSDILIFSL